MLAKLLLESQAEDNLPQEEENQDILEVIKESILEAERECEIQREIQIQAKSIIMGAALILDKIIAEAKTILDARAAQTPTYTYTLTDVPWPAIPVVSELPLGSVEEGIPVPPLPPRSFFSTDPTDVVIGTPANPANPPN